MVRRSLLGWIVALAFLCSVCAVDATVTVKVREDGSGFVSVQVVADAEAVQAVEVGGGKLEDRVRLSDLPAAGWSVEPWVRNPDGSASLTFQKPFTSVDEVPAIIDELNGANGPLRDASFDRSRSFFATKFRAHAVVDLGAATTGVGDDAELASRLVAEGLDVIALDQQLLTRVRENLTVHLVVDLPGKGKTVIEPPPGQSATLDASSSVRDPTKVLLVLLAAALAFLAGVVLLWPRRRRRRRRGRGGTPWPSGDSGRGADRPKHAHHLPEAPHSGYRRRPAPQPRRDGPVPRVPRRPWPER